MRDQVAVQNTHGRTKDVQFDLRAEPCWVSGHADGLGRAVGNLLDNARKWSPPGQPVSVECRDGTVVVHDHGPGIAEADLPHIFDRFYRSSAARGLPGSGLGLAIVAQVVTAEGGTIVAENDPAGGARMTLRLPTVDEPRPARSTRTDHSSRSDSSRVLMERQPAAQVRGAHWASSTPSVARSPPPATATPVGTVPPRPCRRLPLRRPSRPAVRPQPSATSSIRLPKGSST